MKPESVTFPTHNAGNSDGMPMSVEARLTDYRPDGSVEGSYPAETMDQLLRYHSLPEVGAATGATALAGEVVEG